MRGVKPQVSQRIALIRGNRSTDRAAAASQSRLRIAMVGLRGIPHTYGGGEEFVLHLAPRLAARGHQVTVYCRSGHYKSDRTPEYRGVQRVFLPTLEHKSLGQFLHSLLAMLHVITHKFDVVYVHTLPSGLHSILPWLFRMPVVVNVNGLDWQRAKWGGVARLYFKVSREAVLRVARIVVNDSQHLRRYYLERFGRDSVFIPYGAEIRSSRNPNLIQRWGLSPESYYLVACRLVPENNLDMIIDAYARATTSRQLIVAGATNYASDWLEALKARAGRRVHFIGHVADPDAMLELHCAAFAYLHGHSVGGTNPSLLKALGCGNAVVAFASPYNIEVLRDSHEQDCGLLFKDAAELAAKLNELEQRPELLSNLRERAPARIRSAYSWDAVTDSYEDVFLSVGSSRR